MKAIYAILILIILGCGKEGITDIPSISQPANGVEVKKAEAGFTADVVYDQSFEDRLFDITESSFRISTLHPKASSLIVGKIVPFGITPSTPDGDIRRILSTRLENEILIVETEKATLSDLFNNLSIEVNQHNYEQKPVLRSIKYEKEVLDVIGLEFTGGLIMNITPEMAINHTLIHEIDIDFENKVFNKIRFGVENFSMLAKLTTELSGRIEGTASIDGDELAKFAIKLPNIQFSVYGVPIVITNRIVPNPEVSAKINGNFKLTQEVKFDQPLSAILEVLPNNTAMLTCHNASCSGPAFLYDATPDCEGGVEVGMAFKWSLESSLYGTYDFLKFAITPSLPDVSMSTSIVTENDSTKLVLEGKASAPIEFEISSDILAEAFNLDIFENPLKYEIETFKENLFKKTFSLPCEVNFNIQNAPAVSCSGNDHVALSMRINSPNGSSNGYTVIVDGNEIGSGQYGQQVNLIFPSVKMRYSSTVIIKDNTSTFCRLNFRLNNPCDQSVFCEGDPIPGGDGQEYCTMTLADGRLWTTSNALGGSGLCHANNPQLCIELGAYYTFDLVKSENICPQGFHIPTQQEWMSMLDAESRINSGTRKVPHLFAPSFANFGNIDPLTTNGFNIVAAGIYQGWKNNLPISERFSNGILDNGEVISAYFWTSDETVSTTNLPGGGAYAMRVFASGQYGIAPISKLGGLSCRCINN